MNEDPATSPEDTAHAAGVPPPDPAPAETAGETPSDSLRSPAPPTGEPDGGPATEAEPPAADPAGETPSGSLRSPAPPAGEPEGDPDPGAESAESAETEAAKAEAEKAKAEAAALKDRLLRLQADFDNFRKRQARDRAEWIQQSNADLLEELLPVLDQTDAAIASVSKDSSEAAKPFREGFELVRRSFLNAVAKFGLKPVEGVVGKPLDTATSEAITIMRTGQTAPGCVVYETRKGYSLNGKVLRAAQVVVEDEAEEPAPEAEKPAEEPAPAEPAGNQEA